MGVLVVELLHGSWVGKVGKGILYGSKLGGCRGEIEPLGSSPVD